MKILAKCKIFVNTPRPAQAKQKKRLDTPRRPSASPLNFLKKCLEI